MKAATRVQRKRRKTILCVDDDHTTRLVFYDVFSHHGLRVVLGINGRDGLREFRESKPDIVVTDCQMETPTAGLRLARAIKKISKGRIPVILLSWEEFIDTPAGPDLIIKKPSSVLKVVAAVDRFLLLPKKKS